MLRICGSVLTGSAAIENLAPAQRRSAFRASIRMPHLAQLSPAAAAASAKSGAIDTICALGL
jgi:hypothetical protein